jgi:hypothetical protein
MQVIYVITTSPSIRTIYLSLISTYRISGPSSGSSLGHVDAHYWLSDSLSVAETTARAGQDRNPKPLEISCSSTPRVTRSGNMTSHPHHLSVSLFLSRLPALAQGLCESPTRWRLGSECGGESEFLKAHPLSSPLRIFGRTWRAGASLTVLRKRPPVCCESRIGPPRPNRTVHVFVYFAQKPFN